MMIDDDGWAQLNTRNDLDLSTEKAVSVDTSARKQLLSTEMGVLVDAKEKKWVLSTKKGISVDVERKKMEQML